MTLSMSNIGLRTLPFLFLSPLTAYQDSFIKAEDYGSKQSNIGHQREASFWPIRCISWLYAMFESDVRGT
jgi:hypothetical protein